MVSFFAFALGVLLMQSFPRSPELKFFGTFYKVYLFMEKEERSMVLSA